MPFELQVIQANEFVRFGTDERLDFEASKHVLQLMAQACRKRGLDRALLDLRALPVAAKPLFTTRQLAALIETFHEVGFGRNQRLAVLYKSDPHGGIWSFAFIGRLRGWHVMAFSEFESALLWLSDTTQRQTARPKDEVPIRITKRQNMAVKPPAGAPEKGQPPHRQSSRMPHRESSAQ